MKRKIYETLLEWKNTSRGKKAILIDGARRVGKSYVVRKFAENEYKSFIFIDFNNVPSEIKELFEKYLYDLDTFFTYLSALMGVVLHRRESVIVFDEVQMYPKARGAIKYLVEDGRYDYIETGSLISINKNVKDIVIPSEERHIEMFPMDFEEFLWAKGETAVMDLIKLSFTTRRPLGPLHQKTMRLFREYMMVGGMPQAVKAFIEGEDFLAIDRIKRDILTLYRNDISKYADKQELKTLAVFDQIPAQLNRHERKFRISDLSEKARLREYDSTFFWLADSMVVNMAYNCTDPNIGLYLNADHTRLKCYMGDTGLLITMCNAEREGDENNLYRKLITDKLEVNKGMFFENIVAQMLRASGHKLFFFTSYSKTDASRRIEIDFLIRSDRVTSRHNIIPIEVKSTVRYSLSSLTKFQDRYSSYLGKSVVISPSDLREDETALFLPPYMTSLL